MSDDRKGKEMARRQSAPCCELGFLLLDGECQPLYWRSSFIFRLSRKSDRRANTAHNCYLALPGSDCTMVRSS
jgi:hypothetical protein